MSKASKPGPLTRAAKLLGAKGGKKGGPARAKALPAKRRQEIARKGGQASKGR
jgi:general stress protein YciG